MLTLLLGIPQRKIFYIDQNSQPASFLIIDDKAGGILINSPIFSDALLSEINKKTNIDYIFLPSRFGANSLEHSLEQWKAAT